MAYWLERDHGVVVMPRRMQIEFSAVVQKQTDASETEMNSAQLWELFQLTYLPQASTGSADLHYLSHQLTTIAAGEIIALTVSFKGQHRTIQGSGAGPIEAAVNALGSGLQVVSYEERAIGSGAGAQAMAIIEMATSGNAGTRFGAGVDANIVTASLKALVNAAQRLEHSVI